MPTAGDRTDTKAALQEIETLAALARKMQGTLVIAGDLNSLLHPLQHTADAFTGKSICTADSHMQHLVTHLELHQPTTLTD